MGRRAEGRLVSVSIVMPAHNEEHYLDPAVRELVPGLRAGGHDFEFVVIENGSTDATIEVAERLAQEFDELRLHTLPRADYGLALRTGLLAATGDVVVNFDVDYYDLGFLERALGLIAYGRRPCDRRRLQARGGHPGQSLMAASSRHVGLQHAAARRLRVRVSDTHGMKALVRDRAVVVARACRFDADLFDTELVIRAERLGLGVAELPVTVAERRPSRTSIVGRVVRSIWGLARLRLTLWRERSPRT